MNCSIITIHHIHNFGSVFQAYALYQFLKENGHKVEIIDYRPAYYEQGKNRLKTVLGKLLNLQPYVTRKKKFENFIQHHNNLTHKTFRNVNELKEFYKDQEQIFIAGGDQLWNNYHPCGNDDAYKLCFSHAGTKIAYGTSMGRDNFTNEELETIGKQVQDFRCIMLREKSTVQMLADHTQAPVYHVIDPVGLIDVEKFKAIAKKPDISEPYAVMYLADASELLDASVEELSNKFGLKIIHICGFRKKCYCDVFAKDVGPEEILGYILHADFVLSASFHATMFSLLFEKQFATLLPGEKTNARIQDMLSFVGLEDRILHNKAHISCIGKAIDYTPVREKIDQFRKASGQMLLDCLNEIEKK